MLLNFLFLVHAGLALLLALLLLFFPDWVTHMVTGITWAPGDMANVAKVYARFTAAGLILIVAATSFARQSASSRVRWVAIWCMIIVSLVGLAVGLFIPFYLLMILTVVVNVILIVAYIWILNFRDDEI